MNILLRFRQLYKRFFAAVDYLQTPFLLAVRLYWGWQLEQTGWGHLTHLPKVTGYFTTLGVPMPAQTALFTSCLEFFGAIFLTIGLLSRLTALALTINMFMAYVIGDREALLSIFSDPDKFYAAAPYTFLIASLIILCFGPGKIALDTLLDRLFDRAAAHQPPASPKQPPPLS